MIIKLIQDLIGKNAQFTEEQLYSRVCPRLIFGNDPRGLGNIAKQYAAGKFKDDALIGQAFILGKTKQGKPTLEVHDIQHLYDLAQLFKTGSLNKSRKISKSAKKYALCLALIVYHQGRQKSQAFDAKYLAELAAHFVKNKALTQIIAARLKELSPGKVAAGESTAPVVTRLTAPQAFNPVEMCDSVDIEYVSFPDDRSPYSVPFRSPAIENKRPPSAPAIMMARAFEGWEFETNELERPPSALARMKRPVFKKKSPVQVEEKKGSPSPPEIRRAYAYWEESPALAGEEERSQSAPAFLTTPTLEGRGPAGQNSTEVDWSTPSLPSPLAAEFSGIESKRSLERFSGDRQSTKAAQPGDVPEKDSGQAPANQPTFVPASRSPSMLAALGLGLSTTESSTQKDSGQAPAVLAISVPLPASPLMAAAPGLGLLPAGPATQPAVLLSVLPAPVSEAMVPERRDLAAIYQQQEKDRWWKTDLAIALAVMTAPTLLIPALCYYFWRSAKHAEPVQKIEMKPEEFNRLNQYAQDLKIAEENPALPLKIVPPAQPGQKTTYYMDRYRAERLRALEARKKCEHSWGERFIYFFAGEPLPEVDKARDLSKEEGERIRKSRGKSIELAQSMRLLRGVAP